MPDSTISIDGKSYPLAWGNLARIRFSGIPTETRQLGGVVPLATMVWAAIAQKPNPFPSWEHLAEHLTPDSIPAIETALVSVLPVADAEKKSEPLSGHSPA